MDIFDLRLCNITQTEIDEMSYSDLIANLQIMRRKQALGLLKHVGLFPLNELPWTQRQQNPNRKVIEVVE